MTSTGPASLPLSPDGQTPPRVITIAGSDSGGGAGLQADLRSMALLGVHGCAAVTAVTVQNSLGVSGIHPIPPATVGAQLTSVITDIGVQAGKTGMLAAADIVIEVAERWTQLDPGPLVVDPVCASMHGDQLLPHEALEALRHTLFPLATVVTPNLDEVRLLTGIDVTGPQTAREAARALVGFGARWALVKGGHLRGSTTSTDVLYDGSEFLDFPAPRLDTPHDHGGGDTLSTAISCALAHGFSVPEATAFAKRWITRSLRAAYPLGAGHGPVSPLWRLTPWRESS